MQSEWSRQLCVSLISLCFCLKNIVHYVVLLVYSPGYKNKRIRTQREEKILYSINYIVNLKWKLFAIHGINKKKMKKLVVDECIDIAAAMNVVLGEMNWETVEKNTREHNRKRHEKNNLLPHFLPYFLEANQFNIKWNCLHEFKSREGAKLKDYNIFRVFLFLLLLLLCFVLCCA